MFISLYYKNYSIFIYFLNPISNIKNVENINLTLYENGQKNKNN